MVEIIESLVLKGIDEKIQHTVKCINPAFSFMSIYVIRVKNHAGCADL